MSRYRVEEREHTPHGDDLVCAFDRAFGRVLDKASAEAVVAWEYARHPERYEPNTSHYLVAFDPDDKSRNSAKGKP